MTEVEICVADAGGVAAAVSGGADRVELCAALEVGGLTPSWGAVMAARDQAGAAFVAVLIRPRAGDFVFTQDEVSVMERDIAGLTEWADLEQWDRLGFAIGALLTDGKVDLATTQRLVQAASGRRVGFHKAFDTVPDADKGMAELLDLGVEGALTSAGDGPCIDNLDALGRLARSSGAVITAAGGVRPANVAQVAATGVRRVHLRAPRAMAGTSSVGSAYDQTWDVTDAAMVQQVVDILASAGLR